MADLATEAGLIPEEPFLKGASKICVYLWDTTWSHATGTKEGDADALHDMRVAIRRLRSALQNFEGNAELKLVPREIRREMKDFRRRLGRLGDALGAVRDFDVLDEYLQKYAGKHLPGVMHEASGLVQFDQYLKATRDSHFAPMVRKIEKSQQPGRLQESFARWAHGIAGAFGPEQSVQEVARQILPVRIDEVLSLAPLLDQDEDEESHHEVRKALRRLRYTLEVFAPCYNEAVKPRIKVLVSLQDQLGEMQDRTVLAETAQRAFKDQSTLPGDAQAFLDFGAQRRVQLLKEVRRDWQKHQKANFWEELRTL
jgi:CHAD domain-containing protein